MSTPGPEAPRPRVIFADDSPTQRMVVGALLAGAFEVELVSDGLAALRAIVANPPDVIVSDLQMPGLSGDQLLRSVKADPGLRRIPFILVTGEEDAALRTMAMGADDFLRKPFGPEELRVRVAAAVRSRGMFLELEGQHAELIRVHKESKLLELELRQAQKLEAVGRLAAGIAHELNTPIQYIGDNARFLADAFAGLSSLLGRQRHLLDALSLPTEAREGLASLEDEIDLTYLLEQVPQTIRRTLDGVNRVATIVRAMKQFAHPDQKDMAATDLNQALQATLEVARGEYKFVANVETVFSELPPVTCHAGELNQVFLNVLVNAAHAIADRAAGSSDLGTIRVATALDGGEVVVSIADTGGGIPEGIRERIFDPFFTTKEVGRGTGQGLAIARSVMEKHHGSITFDTVVGQGTTFHIRLPVAGWTAPGAGAA